MCHFACAHHRLEERAARLLTHNHNRKPHLDGWGIPHIGPTGRGKSPTTRLQPAGAITSEFLPRRREVLA